MTSYRYPLTPPCWAYTLGHSKLHYYKSNAKTTLCGKTHTRPFDAPTLYPGGRDSRCAECSRRLKKKESTSAN